MDRITHYDVAQGGPLRQLVNVVEERIAEGWQPFGNVIVLDGSLFAQVLVMTEESEKHQRRLEQRTK